MYPSSVHHCIISQTGQAKRETELKIWQTGCAPSFSVSFVQFLMRDSSLFAQDFFSGLHCDGDTLKYLGRRKKRSDTAI